MDAIPAQILLHDLSGGLGGELLSVYWFSFLKGGITNRIGAFNVHFVLLIDCQIQTRQTTCIIISSWVVSLEFYILHV